MLLVGAGGCYRAGWGLVIVPRRAGAYLPGSGYAWCLLITNSVLLTHTYIVYIQQTPVFPELGIHQIACTTLFRAQCPSPIVKKKKKRKQRM